MFTMKNRLYLIIAGIVVILLIFIIHQSDKTRIGKLTDIVAEDTVYVEMNAELAKNNTADVVVNIHFQDLGGEGYECGQSFDLEIKENGAWYEVVGKGMGWSEESTWFPAYHIKTESVNLSEHFGTLEPGQYRLIKEIWGYGGLQYAIVEFAIK